MLRSGAGLACVLLVGACGKSDFIAGDGTSGSSAAGASAAADAGGSATRGGSAGTGTGASGRGGSSRGGSGVGGSAAGATGTSGSSANNCNCLRGAYLPVCGADGNTYDAVCGMDCVPVEISCQGACPCGSGGSAGSGGSGASSGAGGGAGVTSSGGSSGMSGASGSAGAACGATDDPNHCLCFKDADCDGGSHCLNADCATGKTGACSSTPPSGCFANVDCPDGQTCVGGRLAPCGSTQPDVLGTCTATCTTDDPTTCPSGYGCACQSANNPSLPPDCVCHKQCAAPSDCSGTDSMCGCGSGVADGLCVSNCFCSCG